MYRDRDFELQHELPPHDQVLTQDLEMGTLFDAMAQDDEFLLTVARKAVLTSLANPAQIRYRQQVLKDCLKHPAVVSELYQIALEGLTCERKVLFGVFGRYPGSILSGSVQVLGLLMGVLRRMRNLADAHAGHFESWGFTTLFAMLQHELGDEYFASSQEYLRELELRNGVLISAQLGEGNKGINYALRKPPEKETWLSRLFTRNRHSYTLSDRDESGARAMSELRDRGLNTVANALAQSANHITGFFAMLRTELAFYVGCLNLHDRLVQKGEPVCFPEPVEAGEIRYTCQGLYDVCLALRLEQRVVGNDTDADNNDLVIITGANRGGKSTFLRSVGLAQLLMQCGMFVPAESFRANVCTGLFTHFKREEDATMKSGKLDEELGRMSEIVNHLAPGCMVLFNESFAATNEREGSEIARQIVCALLEERIRVFFVTPV